MQTARYTREEKLNKKIIQYALFLCFLGLNGCASSAQNQTDERALEKYNHAMFKFNRVVEKGVIRPVAKGYRKITNGYVRQRVTDFFNNVAEPVSMANHILQGELKDSGQNLARFMVNTTIGGLGLYDVAAKAGLEQKNTGFDETLAAWCVPDGPYIVLPILGPSTPRAATGWVADAYSSPSYWIAKESGDDNKEVIYYGTAALKYLNKYAENLKFIEGMEESSLDYYETVRSAYMQNRTKIKVCGIKQGEALPSYDFDMDMDED